MPGQAGQPGPVSGETRLGRAPRVGLADRRRRDGVDDPEDRRGRTRCERRPHVDDAMPRREHDVRQGHLERVAEDQHPAAHHRLLTLARADRHDRHAGTGHVVEQRPRPRQHHRVQAGVVAHLVEDRAHAGVEPPGRSRGEGPPVAERRRLAVHPAERVAGERRRPHGAASRRRVLRDVVRVVQAGRVGHPRDVGCHLLGVRHGCDVPEPLAPPTDVRRAARVLAEEVALDEREAALDEVEDVAGVERVERLQLGQPGVELEARVDEVAADAHLVLVDDQRFGLLRHDGVQAPSEPWVRDDGSPEREEVGAEVQVVHVAEVAQAEEPLLGLVQRDRGVVEEVVLVVLHGRRLQAPPVARAGVHGREDLVEGMHQEAGVVCQQQLVVGVDHVPADQVSSQQGEGAEVVAAVRDAPRAARDVGQLVQLTRLEHAVGEVVDVGVARQLAQVGHDVVVDDPVAVVRGDRGRSGAGWRRACGWGVRAGAGAPAPSRAGAPRGASAAAGRRPPSSGRGGRPSRTRGRSEGWGSAAAASRGRRGGGRGRCRAAAGGVRSTRRRPGTRWPPPRLARHEARSRPAARRPGRRRPAGVRPAGPPRREPQRRPDSRPPHDASAA